MMRLLAGQIGKVNVTQRGKISTNATNVNILFFNTNVYLDTRSGKTGQKMIARMMTGWKEGQVGEADDNHGTSYSTRLQHTAPALKH